MQLCLGYVGFVFLISLCPCVCVYIQVFAYKKPEYLFHKELLNTIPNNLTKEMFKSTSRDIQQAVKNIFSVGEFSEVYFNYYKNIEIDAIGLYIEHNNLYPITHAYKVAADYCYNIYKNQLGAYFRNTYYILEMLSEFNSPKNYAKIFRAQLSKDELIVLFFNAFSSQSTDKTRRLYLNADLFNNLKLADVRLSESADMQIETTFLKNLYNLSNKYERIQ